MPDIPAPFAREYVTFIRRILSVAETGEPVWDPAAVYKYNDGPEGSPQWTLSIGFTELGGNLEKVLQRYEELNGAFAAEFASYMAVMGQKHLADPEFRTLLQKAGREDPLMMQAQEEMFNELYLGPAFEWASANGFALPLSYLVIADSFLHSGSMLAFLMNRFTEKKPKDGGDEQAWITAYVKTRREWLAAHSSKLLRNTVYRCNCFLAQIEKDNWNLEQEPVVMHGTSVSI
jgi:chitosanase